MPDSSQPGLKRLTVCSNWRERTGTISVYDLQGCGDGRIVIAAAKDYGARGIGIDLNPKRIEEANANAKAAEVENLVQFRLGNFYKVDFSDATVVAIPPTNNQLRITSHSVETAESRFTRRIE